jgi:hypothetical protein
MVGRWLARWRNALRRPLPQVVIDSPNYTHLHSGIRCLHALCDRLNRLGVSAAVTSRKIDSRVRTPQIHRGVLRLAPWRLDQSVVIYPEITAGNPLGAKHVVRYLLNKPGFFNRRGMEGWGPSDYFIHFAEEFRPVGLQSRLLRFPLIDTSIFKPRPLARERKGFLVYSHRHRPDVGSFPDWIDEWTLLVHEQPRDPPTMAALYRSSRALIVGERTAAIPEALHCHCPVIMLPHRDYAPEPIMSFFAGHGLVLGFDKDGLARATETAPAFAAHYAAQFTGLDRQILDFVADVGRHFGLPRLQNAPGPQTAG